MVLMAVLFLFVLSAADLIAEPVLNCGMRSGDYSPLKRWPFHVGLYVRELPQQEHYFCGGTLVGARTVLTAAHCVVGYRTTQSTSKPLLTVHVGEYELNNPERNGTAYHVAAVVIHPEYNVKLLTNDVAVLQLVKQVKFSDAVQPACLWPVNDTSLENTPGSVATTIGWGMTVNEQFSNALTEKTHPLPTKIECERQFGASFLKMMGKDAIICAKTSVCAGSGGSGLYVKKGSRMFLRGIVSFGPKTDSSHRCGVNILTAFVNIALYTSWIQGQLVDNSTLVEDGDVGGDSWEID